MNKLNITKFTEYDALEQASTRILAKLKHYLMDDGYTPCQRLDTLHEIEHSIDECY